MTRKIFGFTLLALGAIPLLLAGPEAIIWAIRECPYDPSNCRPIPYRMIAGFAGLLVVALAGIALLIAPWRAKNSK